MGGCRETDDPALRDTHKNRKQHDATQPPSSRKNDTQVSITLGEQDDIDSLKILTLGAGESGKSTILKHIEILYGGGLTQDQKTSIRTAIRENLISDMKSLVSALKQSGKTYDQTLSTSIKLIEEISVSEDELVLDVADSIADLWSEPAVKEVYKEISEQSQHNQHNFQLCEFADYFFDNVVRISEANYTPTNEDILKMRKRTVGSFRFYFNFNTTKVTLVDVGGQKLERNKWQPMFAGVDYLIFVVSLSDFDQYLWEEDSIRRTQDSIMLFSQIAGAEVFQDVPIFLIMNKVDAFQQKLKRIPDKFKEAYPGFTTTHPTTGNEIDVNDAIEHIKKAFLKRVGSRSDKGWIESIPTNAIDQESVKNLVQKIAVRVVNDQSGKH